MKSLLLATAGRGNDDVIDLDIFTSQTYSNGVFSQEIKRRLKLGRVTMEELGEIISNKEVSLKTKAKITHALIIPMYRWESWTVKTDKKLTHLKPGAGEELYGYPGL